VVLPYLAATTTVDWLVPAVTGSTVYVLERNVNNELIFRLATQNTGFIVTSGAPTLFYPDVRFLTATTIRIAYSLTVADAAADLVLHDVNIQTGAHSKATVVAGSLVWVPQPALPTLPVPTSGGSAQLLAHAQGVYQQPVVDPTSGGRISVPWYRFLDALVKIVAGPFNLNSGQFVGVLQQPNGGTGTTTGLTNISPPAVQFTQASVLLGRGQGGGAGQGQEITLSSGLTMTGTALSAVVSGLQFVTVDPATPANGDVWFKITGAAGAGELSINVRRNGTTTSIPMASGIP
jgi:hypothetical protein